MNKERWNYIKQLKPRGDRMIHESSYPTYDENGKYLGNSRGITYVKPKEEKHDS